jgi:nicotinamide mononucleotide transporter
MNWNAMLIYLAKNWLEIVGVVTCVVSTWLTAKRRVSCWPIGLISDFAYLVIFYEARLYAGALLVVIGLPIAFYGWWNWFRGYREEGEVKVVRQPLSSLLTGLALGAVGSIVLGIWMKHIHAALPYLDAALASFSVIGGWWEMRKYISNWWLWIAVNVIYVGEFISQNLLPTALLYAGLTVLSVFGISQWRRAARKANLAVKKSSGCNLVQVPAE